MQGKNKRAVQEERGELEVTMSVPGRCGRGKEKEGKGGNEEWNDNERVEPDRWSGCRFPVPVLGTSGGAPSITVQWADRT